MLFNLSKDLGEKENIADKHPEKLASLLARMKKLDSEITENARPTFGTRK